MAIFSVSSDAPSSPGMVRLSAIKSRSLEITWSRPHDGNSPILNYIIEYSNLPGKFQSFAKHRSLVHNYVKFVVMICTTALLIQTEETKETDSDVR